ncbi:hypothetical protein HUS23_08465 [Ectothiorhodospiraceae bacterium 2226]|nr:hypothetical protein HUS23_08465 [Ectothiorhodospiraceae bacterium 2226]
MRTQERFYRPAETGREPRCLPAALYNGLRLLQQRAPEGYAFLPLRSMQYLAVIDPEEMLFVDGMGPRIIEIAWQRFRPQRRAGLNEPVPFEVVYYAAGAARTMERLLAELGPALRLRHHKDRARPAPPAPVVRLRDRAR